MSLFKSVATFGSFTMLSRISGFLRDMVLAKYLGAGMISDAFFISFKLPNLFRSLFAEGAFNAAFVPMVSSKFCSECKESLIKFSSSAISVLAFFLAIFVALMHFLMPFVVGILAPGFIGNPEKFQLAVELSRITFPFLLFISIVSFQSGILNSLGKFAAPASAPIILNLLMIASVFIFMPISSTPIYGIAAGITFAGFIEILWLTYFLRKENINLRPRFDIFNLLKDNDIKTLFKRIAPGVLGSGIHQINMAVDLIIVSLVGTGAISWLYYANRIQQLPLGVVGAAISVAVLPILSQHLKKKDDTKARLTQDKAIEYGALLAIPAAIAIIILAKPIVIILFQHGKFGTFETEMTFRAVIAYSIGLPFYVFVKALAPNFFARGDTKTPVKYSLVVFLTNLIFALLLMKPFGHVGIAAAASIAALVSLFQYIRGLKKRGYWSFSKELTIKVAKISVSSIIMGIILLAILYAFEHFSFNWLNFSFIIKLIIFGAICFIGLATFALSAKIMGVLDIGYISKRLLSKGK